ncbi:hypothetical protein, variant 1 [Aphanomyces invadans]|uniref:Potassium channel domain-containing protein n=1 Tax=Aphanomyces invadans TaxID=157072 RepID=A0A024TS01_9STRA|nr:hypothetical protein, variant 1 [Aphanomyces invadans]ETV96794.1 hypothetical protein, variant 1 [Aphanomyces invadans]|eukprot:XP_008874570.1 hypothetical protein, variant 1 [Aphanomyces invadans]
MAWWWSTSPWVVKTRAKSTYVERQESGTGLSIRHPWKRVVAVVLLLGVNIVVHVVNPVAYSRAMVAIPVYGTAFNFLCRAMLPDDTIGTVTLRVTLALLTVVLGCIFTRAMIFPILRRYLSMFSSGHAELGRLESIKTSGGLAAISHRTVNAFANGGRPYSIDVYIGSVSQGSWTIMYFLIPLYLSLVATIFNAFAPANLEVTSVLPIRYVELYPTVRAVSLVMNGLLLFSTLDVMLQDHIRCESLFDNWMHGFRWHVWRHQYVRISCFWLVFTGLVAYAAIGLPHVHAAMTDWFFQHVSTDVYFMESWRALFSGAVVMLDVVVLMQDWDFPTAASPKHVYIPGLATNVVCLGHNTRFRLAFTCKWIVMGLIMLMLPLDVWTLVQQLNYTPLHYGQMVAAATLQVVSMVNTTQLDALACGALCFHGPLPAHADVVPTLGRYFSWPAEDKFPAVCLVVYVVFLCIRMIANEDSGFVVSSQMQGVKEQNYRRQLDHSSLPPRAVQDLVRLADIKRQYWLRRHSDDICVGLALFGLVLMLLQLRCIWQVRVEFAMATYPSNMVSTPGQTYALLIFISTLLLVFELHRRFRLTVDILKLRNKLSPSTTMWRHPSIRLQLLVELVANLAIVPPLVTGVFVVNEYQMHATTCPTPLVRQGSDKCYLVLEYPYETLGMVMFLRLYWIVRLVRNHSGFYGQRVDFIGSLNNVSTDSPLWHFRAIFYHHPVFAFLTCTILTWVATAVGVSVMERPLPSPLDSELTAMWMVIVTMATVGYGDFVPRTVAGRVITVLGGIVGGVIVISMLTSLFMGSLQTTRGEEKVLHVVRYKRWQRRRLDASVNLIAAAWKLSKQRRNHPSKVADGDTNRLLYKYMQEVRELRLGAVTEGENTVAMGTLLDSATDEAELGAWWLT